jgi:hypothetical protein
VWREESSITKLRLYKINILSSHRSINPTLPSKIMLRILVPVINLNMKIPTDYTSNKDVIQEGRIRGVRECSELQFLTILSHQSNVVSSIRNTPTNAPHSVVMFEIVSLSSTERHFTPSLFNPLKNTGILTDKIPGDAHISDMKLKERKEDAHRS